MINGNGLLRLFPKFLGEKLDIVHLCQSAFHSCNRILNHKQLKGCEHVWVCLVFIPRSSGSIPLDLMQTRTSWWGFFNI